MKKRDPIRWWAVLVWLLVWQLASMAVGSPILLVSPWRVLVRLGELVMTGGFWLSILHSLGRMALGFTLAFLLGLLLALGAHRYPAVHDLLSPLMLTIRTVPVASFIILALIWLPSRHLAVLISFLMVLPILYTNTLEGIRARDPAMGEMARVFRMPLLRRMRCIDLPQVMPFLRSGCTVALGLCWKSGIAAEVIGMPKGSIGERLQQAKVYLDTPDLFAWTVVIVCVSMLFEKFVLLLIRTAAKRLERV